MNTRRFLALIGSPRVPSVSETLAEYVIDGLAKCGWETKIVRLGPALKQEGKWSELAEEYRQADVIALLTPLYVDALPGHTTQALEWLAAEARTERERRFFALVNCGFLEAEQNDTALAICRLFARDAGLAWLGGLALGAGGAMSGQKLEKLGGMFAHVIRSLDLAIEAIDAGQPLPDEALQLMRRRFCPTWLYVLLANFGMLKGAMDHHVLTKIHARPYA
ncbi:MAG: NAD(P)H-dependent oxidoreductase [Armatimonadota bacterium]